GGTALTEEHLSLIGRLTKNIILAFDAEEAGFRAMERGIGLALSSGFAVSIVHLPQDRDPADIVKEDEKKWGEYIGKAKHVIEFYLDMLLEAHKDERSARLKVEEKVIPFITRLKSPIEQAHFVKLVAKSIHIDEDPIWRSIKKYGSTERVSKDKEVEGAHIALEAQNPDKTRLLNIEKHIFSIFLWQQKEEKTEINLEDFQKKFEDITEKQIACEISALSEKDKACFIFEAEAAHEGSKKIDVTIEAMFADLLTQTLKVKLTSAMEAVKEAERNGDEARTKEALSEFHSLSKKMNEV
ncbi:MAG: toprim domain-containing protein, partial [Patescibacteria group bacterium]